MFCVVRFVYIIQSNHVFPGTKNCLIVTVLLKSCVSGKKMLKVLIVKSFSFSQYQVSSHIPIQVRQGVARSCQQITPCVIKLGRPMNQVRVLLGES